MEYLLQQIINGLSLGAVYALIAIGYTMVYGILQMINFAHGDLFMIGAFIAVIALTALAGFSLPLALLLALLATLFFTALYGMTLERVAYRRLRGSPRLTLLITAIGASIFLQNYVQLAQGARVKPLPPLIDGQVALLTRADGFAVSISWLQLGMLGMAVLLLGGLLWLIHGTRLGRAQRAVAEDAGMAALLGVPVARTISLTFGLGAALAAVAGMMVALYYGVVDFFIGFLAGIKAFTAAVLGGIGSLTGAVLGGLLIGLIEALWSGYAGPEYKDVAVFGTLILVLLLRPNGLLGRPDVEKV